MNKRELEDAIKDEVAEWPGVTVEFESGSTHPKAKLMFGELILRRAYPGTPSDSYNGLHKTLGDMRRVMKQLGAERAKPEPSKEDVEKRYSKPNPGRELRPDPVQREPVAPKADVVDQLVEQGAATPDQAVEARASRIIVVADEDQTDEDVEREQALVELQARVDAIEDGIYFDLDDRVYHAVRALGSGSISDLIISAGTFWRGSWLDPNRPELDEEQTAAQKIGKAYHIARLEPDRFAGMYVRELDKRDFPSRGFLSSDEKVKAALKACGAQQTVSGETTAERAQRLLDLGHQGTIWPLEKARWEQTVGGRIPLPAQVYDDIVIDMERIRSIDEIADKLVGGFAEVSVFWTDRHGIRCKARFDYLRPDLWDDFKTFANPNGKVLAQAIADAFRYNRYYIQATHYRDAAEAIRTGGLQVKGEASDEQRAMIAMIQIAPTELACWYVMQEKGGIPNLIARRFEFKTIDLSRRLEAEALAKDPAQLAQAIDALSRPSQIFRLAQAEIEQAKKTFALYSQVYEPGQPWSPIEPVGTIGDDDFNSYWLEGK